MILKPGAKDLTGISEKELVRLENWASQQRVIRRRMIWAVRLAMGAGVAMCAAASAGFIGAMGLTTVFISGASIAEVGFSLFVHRKLSKALVPGLNKIEAVASERHRRNSHSIAVANELEKNFLEAKKARAEALSAAQAIDDFAAAVHNGVAEKITVGRPLALKKNAAARNSSSFIQA